MGTTTIFEIHKCYSYGLKQGKTLSQIQKRWVYKMSLPLIVFGEAPDFFIDDSKSL